MNYYFLQELGFFFNKTSHYWLRFTVGCVHCTVSRKFGFRSSIERKRRSGFVKLEVPEVSRMERLHSMLLQSPWWNFKSEWSRRNVVFIRETNPKSHQWLEKMWKQWIVNMRCYTYFVIVLLLIFFLYSNFSCNYIKQRSVFLLVDEYLVSMYSVKPKLLPHFLDKVEQKCGHVEQILSVNWKTAMFFFWWIEIINKLTFWTINANFTLFETEIIQKLSWVMKKCVMNNEQFAKSSLL